MSFNIRSTSSSSSRRQHHDDRPKSTRTRKIVITLLVLLSLVLIGTVVVLSSVSYYLGIPSWAYLTESEVSWRPEDVIKQLQDPASSLPSRRTVQRRQDWAEVSEAQVESATAAVEGIMGTDALPESWKELEQEMEELDAAEESEELPSYDDSVEVVTSGDAVASTSEESDIWGIDGQGSGGYWMQKDWDGRVQGTDSWERLYNVTTRPGETIPRLIHQTWKSDQLPEKWQKAWKECREGMPDYEYMLWTDETSRDFIAKHYPAHLHMFETYKYPIQRADSIRYFILHHFGGVYMDLDIGCRRRLDPLLQGDWEVILPITKPVGVSNDLIFSSKGSAFMDDTIHGLSTFNHQYFTNYPTVMFSTGPMFLSAQYALYSSAHPLTETHPRAEVRILPKSLYGKNAPMSSVPHSFFSHFYGSSWHSDDAGFITFLGVWGKGLMWVGLVVIVLGAIRLIWVKRKSATAQQYQLLSILPTTSTHGTIGHRSGASSPTSSSGSNGPMSPSSTYEMGTLPHQLPSDIASVFKRAGNLILAAPATLLSGDRERDRRGRKKTGLLYFVPALFQPGPVPRSRGRTASEASQLPLRRPRKNRVPPPPYEQITSSSKDNEIPRSRSPAKMGGTEADSTMDEVDAFLHEADTEGESSNYADAEAEADADGDDQSEREWAAWDGKANERT
ncbi:MIPC synthase [Kwoniella heveanensis CBS 569]|nr:MIPC synthase [Kwoniella heveanensis CBS 569]